MAQTQTAPKFTPGPYISVRNGDDFDIRADEHGHGLIGRVYNPASQLGERANIELEAEETEANARLFAAGPRLYGALSGLLDQIRHPKRSRGRPEVMADADAALAHARGEA